MEIPDTYPPALEKACSDNFHYALMLTNGLVYEFTHAEVIDDRFVKIYPEKRVSGPFRFTRGLEIKLNNIMWVSDGPHEM